MRTYLKSLLYIVAPLAFWIVIQVTSNQLSSWAAKPILAETALLKELGVSGRVDDEQYFSLTGKHMSEVTDDLEVRKNIWYSVVFGLYGLLFLLITVEAKFLAKRLKT